MLLVAPSPKAHSQVTIFPELILEESVNTTSSPRQKAANSNVNIDEEIAKVASTTTGSRNDALNRCAFVLGKAGLDLSDATERLTAACRENGLLAEDGEQAVTDTITRAFADGQLTLIKTERKVSELGKTIRLTRAIEKRSIIRYFHSICKRQLPVNRLSPIRGVSQQLQIHSREKQICLSRGGIKVAYSAY